MTQAELAVGIGFLAALWFGVGLCWRPVSLTKTFVKTLSTAALAYAAVVAQAPHLLITALILGCIGDFCLSREGDGFFVAGLGAFAVSHLSYIALFATSGAVFALAPTTLLIAVLGLAMCMILYRPAGALRWPVMIYICIIAGMGIGAVGLPAGYAMAVLAAVLFIISDCVIGVEVFVLSQGHHLRRITPFVIWTFYWAAQCLFLFSFSAVVGG